MIRRADQALSAAKRSSSGGRARLGEGLGRGARPQPGSAAGHLHRRQVEGLSQHEAADGLGGGGGRLHRPRRARAQLRGAPVRDAARPPRGRARARAAPGGLELLGGLERAEGAVRPFRLGPRDLAVVERACREGNFVGRSGPGAGRAVALRAAPLAAGAAAWVASCSRSSRPASPSKARTGSSSTPSPPRWRWPWTACGSSSASASASARRRSGWRRRSRTCGASCTAPGSPIAPTPWSPCSAPPARWRAPTPPSSSPARAAPARRCWPTPSTS